MIWKQNYSQLTSAQGTSTAHASANRTCSFGSRTELLKPQTSSEALPPVSAQLALLISGYRSPPARLSSGLIPAELPPFLPTESRSRLGDPWGRKRCAAAAVPAPRSAGRKHGAPRHPPFPRPKKERKVTSPGRDWVLRTSSSPPARRTTPGGAAPRGPAAPSCSSVATAGRDAARHLGGDRPLRHSPLAAPARQVPTAARAQRLALAARRLAAGPARTCGPRRSGGGRPAAPRGDGEARGGPTHPMSQSMAGSRRPGWLPRPPRPSHRPLMRPRRAPPQRLAAGPAGAARLRLRSRGGRVPRSDTRALGRPEVNTRRSPRPAGGQPGSGPLPPRPVPGRRPGHAGKCSAAPFFGLSVALIERRNPFHSKRLSVLFPEPQSFIGVY